ncbi:CAP domain-containing protein [Aquibacillus sediminis]|uniref:CAP domain-containing protein n=1 Tax=Aquibacillus sediminis TaxID=2574734 RepID=UPI001107B7BD|nr:CAP domain-containing protein [Aquibacillus sediminis]
MSKIRKFIGIIFIVGVFWLIYGNTFQQQGARGVVSEIGDDVNAIKEHPKVAQVANYLHHELQGLLSKLDETFEDEQQTEQTEPEQPTLDAPSNQVFSVYNIELGDDRSEVEQSVGSPNRSSLNEYGVNWVSYHEDYQNFFMVAYNEQNQVAGMYTNQDLVTATNEIEYGSSKASVRDALGEPLTSIRKGLVNYQIENNQEHDTYLVDEDYVTIFYDKHENNTVTALQIISGDLETQKPEFFAEPSEKLKEGFEHQLFDLTNAARVKHGLSPLTWETSVRTTARKHSSDMAQNGYFSHTNLEGQSPFERMSNDNISFRSAGENLAAGQPSSIFAHQGLMNSLGHRENILKERFESLGVGVAFDEDDQPFYTENFLTK